MYDMKYVNEKVMIMACAFALCFPCLVFAGASSQTQDQLKGLAAQTQYTGLQDDSAVIAIRQIRKELADRVLVTQEVLETLEQKATAHFAQMEALLKSDQGKLLAQDSNSLGYATYLRLKEEPAVTLNDINEKQLLLSSLQRQVLVGRDEPEVGYLPNQEIRDQVTLLYHWVKARQEAFDRQISALNRLLRWQPSEHLDTAQGMTLNQKLDERRASWEELLAKIRLLAQKEVEPEVQQVMFEVYRYVAREKGKLEADVLKAQEELSLARKRQGHEIVMQDQAFLLDRARQLADEDLKIRQDNLDSQLRELKALRALNKAMADLELNKLETKTARQQLIAMCESKDVQLLLSPFIKKSYWQPNGRMKQGYERSGMSYRGITGSGALNPSAQGLQHLLTLGTNPANKDRGPWPWPRRMGFISDEQKDDLRKAQGYLIELGPTLVELGYLAK